MNVIVKFGTEKGTGIGRNDEFAGFTYIEFEDASEAVEFIEAVQKVWDEQLAKETKGSVSAFIYGPPSICIIPKSQTQGWALRWNKGSRSAAENFMDLNRFRPAPDAS